MKNLIFTIGTVLVSFSSAFAESNDKQSNTQVEFVKVGDSTDVKPQALCVAGETKSNEEIISQDIEVIENQMETVAPLLPGKSAKEVIADDSKIIEGVNVEIYPLDFKKINQGKKTLKLNNSRLIGSL